MKLYKYEKKENKKVIKDLVTIILVLIIVMWLVWSNLTVELMIRTLRNLVAEYK